MHTALFADIPMLSAVAAAVATRVLRDTAPASLTAPAVVAAAAPQVCTRCNGSGHFIGRNGRALGDCFACKGAGKLAAKPAAAAVAVTDEALRATFDKLRESGLSRVKLRMQGFTVSPAKATGKNPGALYVKESGTYLGKIINGRFDCTSECSAETAAKVAALVADPLAAIKASGLETGRCALCGLELTDPESIARGIGPICAGRL